MNTRTRAAVDDPARRPRRRGGRRRTGSGCAECWRGWLAKVELRKRCVFGVISASGKRSASAASATSAGGVVVGVQRRAPGPRCRSRRRRAGVGPWPRSIFAQPRSRSPSSVTSAGAGEQRVDELLVGVGEAGVVEAEPRREQPEGLGVRLGLAARLDRRLVPGQVVVAPGEDHVEVLELGRGRAARRRRGAAVSVMNCSSTTVKRSSRRSPASTCSWSGAIARRVRVPARRAP